MRPLPYMSVLDNVIAGSMFGPESFAKRRGCGTACPWHTGIYPAVEEAERAGQGTWHGRSQAAGVGRALAAKPDLLLLDEVMSGLNHTETEECVALIREINKSGSDDPTDRAHYEGRGNALRKDRRVHHGEKIAEGLCGRRYERPDRN